jgi:hypothetical protein
VPFRGAPRGDGSGWGVRSFHAAMAGGIA